MFLLFLHGCVTFFLTGLIWVVQLVHYPMFRFLDPKTQSNALKFHQQKISIIVVPLMLFELLSGVYLAYVQWSSLASFHRINMVLLMVIWVHTFGLMVPFHQKISVQLNYELLQKTLTHHWVRTLAWTIKSVLWGGVLWHLMPT